MKYEFYSSREYQQQICRQVFVALLPQLLFLPDQTSRLSTPFELKIETASGDQMETIQVPGMRPRSAFALAGHRVGVGTP